MDEKKIRISYNAPVTLTYALICLVVLIFGEVTHIRPYCYNRGLLNPMTYISMFTYVFGHASWEHYFSNVCYILLLGPMVEEKYGPKQLIFMILSTAFIGGLANIILAPHVALIGASGICFMFIVLSSVTSVSRGEIPLTLILIALIYVGSEVYDALFVLDNVSQLCHIAGGICGAVFGLSLTRHRRHR